MTSKNFFSYTLWLPVAVAYGLVGGWGFTQGLAEFGERWSNLVWSHTVEYQLGAVPALPAVVSPVSRPVNPVPLLPKPQSLSLLFVGDIMLDRGVRAVVEREAAGDYNWLFDSVRPVLQSGDLVFGNLEGPAAESGANHGSQYSFRMDPRSLRAVVAAGFDILSVANNHSGDWGREAFVDTVNNLKDYQLGAVGNRRSIHTVDDMRIIEAQGYQIGFLAATDVGSEWLKPGEIEPGVWLASDPRWPEAIREAAPLVDFLVVSYHFGEEYQTVPSARQRELAELAIDNGATIVVGHHPHVLQPVATYKNGLIAYSLGNFIFDQDFSDATKAGGILKVNLNKQGIVDWELLPTQADHWYRPTLKVESAGGGE